MIVLEASANETKEMRDANGGGKMERRMPVFIIHLRSRHEEKDKALLGCAYTSQGLHSSLHEHLDRVRLHKGAAEPHGHTTQRHQS
jgi:hypothetical protein